MKRLIGKNGVTPKLQFLSGGESESSEVKRSILGRRSFLKGLGSNQRYAAPGYRFIGDKRERAE
jgi:hypothetical protein